MSTDLRPERAGRIPHDLPLVLRPRLGRILAVFGPLQVGIPIALVVGGFVFMLTVADAELSYFDWGSLLPSLIIIGGGLLQLGIVLAALLPGGPMLAADDRGVWVRTGTFPVRSVFLPWPAVARIHVRRRLWDRAIRVVPLDGRTAMLRRRLTASPLYCGRRTDDVLAELRRLSATYSTRVDL